MVKKVDIRVKIKNDTIPSFFNIFFLVTKGNFHWIVRFIFVLEKSENRPKMRFYCGFDTPKMNSFH